MFSQHKQNFLKYIKVKMFLVRFIDYMFLLEFLKRINLQFKDKDFDSKSPTKKWDNLTSNSKLQ